MKGCPDCADAVAATINVLAANIVRSIFMLLFVVDYCIVFNRVTFLIEETNAEIAHTWAIDDGTTQHVASLLQGDAF